jgi:AraC-like DNA-binding protein
MGAMRQLSDGIQIQRVSATGFATSGSMSTNPLQRRTVSIMPDSRPPVDVTVNPSVLWVDLTHGTEKSLISDLAGAVDIRRITSPSQIRHTIEHCAPPFLCFQFDEPDPPVIDALGRTRREHPDVPVFLITRCCSEQLALCALRIRVWDWVVLPVPLAELRQRIVALTALTAMTRKRRDQLARDIVFPPQCSELPGTGKGSHRDGRRTAAAIAHVAAHFDGEITLDQVAPLCRLSPAQFCRTFRKAHGMSFGQYLMRYRIDRACERLASPAAVVKNVAYSVGFADHSYFSRAFKRQVGVSPSAFHARAASRFSRNSVLTVDPILLTLPCRES